MLKATLEKPNLVMIEDAMSLLSRVFEEDIQNAGMIPIVQRSLAWNRNKPREQHQKDFEAVRRQLATVNGPMIALIDFDLSLTTTYRMTLGVSCPGASEQIDGLALAYDLIRSHKTPSPLMIVVATRLGRTKPILDGIREHALRAGRTSADFKCIKCETVSDDDFEGQAAMTDVSDLPRFFLILKRVWDDWVLQNTFLRYWLAVWSKPVSSGEPGHFERTDEYPPGKYRDLLERDDGSLLTLKAVFCGRKRPRFREQGESVHLTGIRDTLSMMTAAELIEEVTGVNCTVPPNMSQGARIHWPCSPGATFIWRLHLLCTALAYDEACTIRLAIDERASVARLVLPLKDANHFWGGIITRKSGGATMAFRNLLAGLLPERAELETFARDADTAEACGIMERFETPNRISKLGGNPVYRPMCRVSIESDQLTLSWPVSRGQGGVV